MEKHIYTVNLRKAKAVSRNRRTQKAVNILRSYVQQHADIGTLKFSNALNEYLWKNGASNPPNAVEVQVVEQDGVGHVELADIDFEVPDEPEEPEMDYEDLQDEEIAEMTVDEVKELVENNAISAQHALDVEYAGKNRKTLINWLERRVEEPETADEAEEELEAEEEEAEDAAEAEEEQEEAETYDLPEDVIDTFRNGSIDEAKDAAQALGKQEFEKLLNFEEAHQNRKGMKKFLKSNMN